MGRVAGHRSGQIVLVAPDAEMAKRMGLDLAEVPDGLSESEVIHDYEVRRGQLVPRGSKPEAGSLRVAMVSPYQVPCGISTYSEYLYQAMDPLVGECHVFAEREADAPDTPDVTRCWTRSHELSELVANVEAYDPDVVLVEHEYGYFPEARHFLSFMGALGSRRVVTTLHSVYAAHHDKTIIEAACPEIIVHTESARRALLEGHGVSGKVTVIPHGCPEPSQERLWNLYGTRHTLLQFGFGFPYKGWENALQTVAALKASYPDVFYTGLISERWPGSTKQYVDGLNALARKLGVAQNVGLIRGFQTDKALDAYLRTNSVALFPYRDNGEHAVLGCSGAARVAMSKGLPVVAAGVPLFDDLQGVVPRPSTVEGWVASVALCFDDPAPQIESQNRFLASNSWASVARRYVDALS